jgi:LPXTG-motif cell wall-anchored protein
MNIKKTARRAVAVFVALLMFAMPLAVAAMETEAEATPTAEATSDDITTADTDTDSASAAAEATTDTPAAPLADPTANLPNGGSITVSDDGATVTIAGFRESEDDYASISAILNEDGARAKIETLSISGALGDYGWLVAAEIADTATLSALNITTTNPIPVGLLDLDRWEDVKTDLGNTEINFTFDGVTGDESSTSLAAIFAAKGVALNSLILTNESSITLDSGVVIETVNVSGGSELVLTSVTDEGVDADAPKVPQIGTVVLENSKLTLNVDDLDYLPENFTVVSDDTSVINFSEDATTEDIEAFLEDNVEGDPSVEITGEDGDTYYIYNTPDPILNNGVTATVTSSPASLQTSNTAVTATVTLSGTAFAAGSFKVDLTSDTVDISGPALDLYVDAGDSVSDTYEHTFTIPEQSVMDIELTFAFKAAPGPVTYEVIKNFGTFTGSGSVSCEIGTDRFDADSSLRYWKDEYTIVELPEGLTYTSSGNAAGHTIFTLNESGLKQLANGTYKFQAFFSDGKSELITLVVQQESSNPYPPATNDAEILSAGGAKYILGSGKPLVVKSARSMSGDGFMNLLVDDNALALAHKSATLWESTYAKVEEGSTVATLYPAYLDTLSVGNHTVTLAYADGNNATITFAVEKSTAPDTGDDSTPILFIALLMIATAGLAIGIFIRRRKGQQGTI